MKISLSELREMVEKERWKDLLIQLVITHQLDPWDIDVKVIANEFVKYIRQAASLDLSIPANIILAASIMVRYKATALKDDMYVEEESQVEEEYVEPFIAEIPKISSLIRRPPKRKVTLNELIEEIEKVMKKEAKVKEARDIQRKMHITIPKRESIEEKSKHIYAKIKEISDKEGWTTFSYLLKSMNIKDKPDIILTLIILLYLTQSKKIGLKQDELFKEIFINIKENGA